MRFQYNKQNLHKMYDSMAAFCNYPNHTLNISIEPVELDWV